MKYLSQVKHLSKPELIKKASELFAQINKLRLEKSIGKTRNVRQGYILRKQLAIVKTIINLPVQPWNTQSEK